MWWKQSESIHFDWIMSDLFHICRDYEEALADWTDEKWRTEFEQKMTDREYSNEIQEFVSKELERFLLWRIEELKRWKAKEEAERLEKEQKEREEQEWQEELERQAEEELTPFEQVLNEVFESVRALMKAAYKWSDDDWHHNFEEKIVVCMKDGRITEEDVPQIRKDLDAYIEMIRKDRDEYEKNMAVEKKEREEQERLKQEQLEKELQEDRKRKQRKAKQIPEVLELIDTYQLARKNLEEEKSVEHYRDVIQACYCIVGNWGAVGCLDEFAGVSEYYENAVLDYLDTIGTVNSLYHVVVYYTDKNILSQYHDLSEKKHHLKKGLTYVKEFHKAVDDERSAIRYIDCYLQLNQYCRTGEDLEQLSYADKAYKLAKKFVLKYRTEIMVEELDLAKLALAVYYRVHEQETEAERVEKEFEEIKNNFRRNMQDDNNSCN